jgi:diguanylate cyclase (GGDEF)-like protein
VFRHALVISVIALIAGLLQSSGTLKPLSDALTELRFAASPRDPTSGVVLVEIDAKSIAAIGEWPWPRRIHADLIRSLDRLEPSEIAFDIDFSSRSNEADDSALEAALRDAHSSVILAAFNQQATSDVQDPGIVVNQPLPQFREHAWLATVNIEPDADGHVRRYSYSDALDGQKLPSLAALYGGTPTASGSFAIDFSIAGEKIDRISVIDLLQGRVKAERLKGRKVIVGASAIELRDIFQVPNHGLISGSLLQAISTESLLQGRALQGTGHKTMVAGLAILAALMLLARGFKWSHVLFALLCGSVAVEAFACVLQAWRPVILDTSAWHVAFLGFMALTAGREVDLRRALLILANTERRNLEIVLNQVVADSFDGIVVADDEGRIRSASRSAARILQPDRRRNWIGVPVKEMVPVEMLVAMRNAISDGIRGERQGSALRELRLLRHGVEERVIEYIVTPSRLHGDMDDAGHSEERFVVCLSFRDVTERRLAEQRLDHLARYDGLTGLPNRNHFMERLRSTLETRAGNPSGAVLHIGLDRFKTVNDTFGHATGDLLLKAVTRRASELVPSPHLLARSGGDEFTLLWAGPVGKSELDILAGRLIEQISDPYEIHGNRLTIGASIGIAIMEDTSIDSDVIMQRADAALHHAKKAGRGIHCFYEASLEAKLRSRQKLEMELWEALARQEFQIVYQPQFELGSRTLIGVEALLRWQHPERGMIPPDTFIPIAEEIGLMNSLGEWILNEACKEVVRWPKPLKLSVNVSPVQFAHGDFAKTVEKVLARTGFSANRLILEITETLFMQEGSVVQRCLQELKESGIGFALDDFGTGYSSLGYLRKFPLDAIKIDRSFTIGVPQDPQSVAIVQAVIALGRSLGMRLVAEGLETPEQTEALQALGCHDGQGYGLGRPQPAKAILNLLG